MTSAPLKGFLCSLNGWHYQHCHCLGACRVPSAILQHIGWSKLNQLFCLVIPWFDPPTALRAWEGLVPIQREPLVRRFFIDKIACASLCLTNGSPDYYWLRTISFEYLYGVSVLRWRLECLHSEKWVVLVLRNTLSSCNAGNLAMRSTDHHFVWFFFLQG